MFPMTLDETVIQGGRKPDAGETGPVLVVVEGPDRGAVVPLREDSMLVGRKEGCQVLLNSAAVSKHHARITRQGDGFLIEDLHSTNGVRLNGRAIAVATPVRLAHGDSLSIGENVLLFRSGSSLSDQKGFSTIAIDVRKVREEAARLVSEFRTDGAGPTPRT
jgi:pSer/pThr/pTyr-binding forkhead associated (FHA) protein